MLKYNSILMLLVAFSLTEGTDLSRSESAEAKIQRCHSIATDLKNDPKIRLSNADQLLTLQRSDLAAQAYDIILNNTQSDTDLDWKLLAVDGLGKCGIAFKGRAFLTLMDIAANPTATNKQKETARTTFEKWKITIK